MNDKQRSKIAEKKNMSEVAGIVALYNFIIKYPKSLALVAGVVSIFSFAPYFNYGLGVVGFACLMCLLLMANTPKEKFNIGYFFGFVYFAGGFAWVGNALLVDPEEFGWIYPVMLAASGAFFGLFTALPAVCTSFARSKVGQWMIFCGMWVIFEWIRSFFLTGFPWNLLGYSWAFNLNLIQNAAIGGVYLTSLLVIMLYSVWGLLLENLLTRHRFSDELGLRQKSKELKTFSKIVVFLIIIFAVNMVWGYKRIIKNDGLSSDLVVRIVQPSIPQTMKWSRELAEENFQDYIDLSSVKSEVRPDWVIWGETASPFRLDEDKEHRDRAISFLQNDELLIIGMISYHENEGRFLPHNSMVIMDSKGDIKGYYDKSHLVPFGEYIPLRKYLPKFLRPVANAIGEFGQGKGAKVFSIGNYPLFGGAICYEIIFPHEVVDEQMRPEVIINLTNDGWYGESAGPYQHWVAAMFRAIEEGIPVIRVANSGISGIINVYGESKEKLALNEVGYRDLKLEKALSGGTIYGKYGNINVIILCLILVVFGAIKLRKD